MDLTGEMEMHESDKHERDFIKAILSGEVEEDKAVEILTSLLSQAYSDGYSQCVEDITNSLEDV